MKILFLTDSLGLPRIFPEDEILNLEDTYSQIIKKSLPDYDLFQITLTGELSDKIIDQARGYLVNWKPDYIIVGIGINDARPNSISVSLKKNILTNHFFKINLFKIIFEKFQKKFLNRKSSSLDIKVFEQKANQLKNTFRNSKIIWLEIVCGDNYESERPGVIYWKNKFNEKLRSIFGSNFLELNQKFNNKKIFNSDNLHYNKLGHKIISEEILKKIS